MSVTIYSRRVGAVEIVSVVGRLVLGEPREHFRTRLREVLTRQHDVLLDVAELTYADSAGLGEIVSAQTAAASVGRQLKLLAPQRQLLTLLKVTRLAPLFECFETEPAALAAFPERPLI